MPNPLGSMTKLTKSRSPPSSPLSRLSFFGSSSTSSLVGPSRPVVQKRPGGRWTIVRVRSPRTDHVEPMTLDSVIDAEEAEREKERREEEGRGYEGMIRPLYLEDVPTGQAGRTVLKDNAYEDDAHKSDAQGIDPALQEAMFNPNPPRLIYSLKRRQSLSHLSRPVQLADNPSHTAHGMPEDPDGVASRPSTPPAPPPVPTVPDAYRALAPSTPTRSATTSHVQRNAPHASPGSKSIFGGYPLSEYADEVARSSLDSHMPRELYADERAYEGGGGDARASFEGVEDLQGPQHTYEGHQGHGHGHGYGGGTADGKGGEQEGRGGPHFKSRPARLPIRSVVETDASEPSSSDAPGILAPLPVMTVLEPPISTAPDTGLSSRPTPPPQAPVERSPISFVAHTLEPLPESPTYSELERNLSSSTAGTQSRTATARAVASDSGPSTEESVRLETPSAGLLLEAGPDERTQISFVPHTLEPLPESPTSSEMERNPSSSTAGTESTTATARGVASDSDPSTEESVHLATPSAGLLLKADIDSFQWSEEAEVGHPGASSASSAVAAGDTGVAGVPDECNLKGAGGDAPALGEDSLSPARSSSSLDAPISPPPSALSRISWEGDLHHRSSAGTLTTGDRTHVQSRSSHGSRAADSMANESSSATASTITPTRIPLSAEDNHGEVHRASRPRAGSTGAQSTTLSLYSIGGFLMAGPPEPANLSGVQDCAGRRRRISDGSIASSFYLSPTSPITLNSKGRAERGKHRETQTTFGPGLATCQPDGGGSSESGSGSRSTVAAASASTRQGTRSRRHSDMPSATSGRNRPRGERKRSMPHLFTTTTEAESSDSVRVRVRSRSSVRHPYDPPSRRAPPPPTFYIEQTPPVSPATPRTNDTAIHTEHTTPTSPTLRNRVRRLMSASAISLPASIYPTTSPFTSNAPSVDASQGHGHGLVSGARQRSIPPVPPVPNTTPTSIAARKRTPSTSKLGAKVRGLVSASVTSLPAPELSSLETAGALNDTLVATRIEVRTSRGVLAPIFRRSLTTVAGEQYAAEVQPEMVKTKKRVSMGVGNEAGSAATGRLAGKEAIKETPRKGALGEIWRRMSSGRKGRMPKAAEAVPDAPDAGDWGLRPDEWGVSGRAQSSSPVPILTNGKDRVRAVETVLDPMGRVDGTSSSKPSVGRHSIRRKSVPAYSPDADGQVAQPNLSQLGPRTGILTTSPSVNETALRIDGKRRGSLSAARASLHPSTPVTAAAAPLPTLRPSFRPAIRITTAPSPATAPLPDLPSPITLANSGRMPGDPRRSDMSKGSRSRSSSPVKSSSGQTRSNKSHPGRTSPSHSRSRPRTSSSRRPVTLADRQKEEKRRYRRTLIEIDDDELFQQVVGDLSRLDEVRSGSMDQAAPKARVGLLPVEKSAAGDRGRGATVAASRSPPREADQLPGNAEMLDTAAARMRKRASMPVGSSAAYDPWKTHSLHTGIRTLELARTKLPSIDHGLDRDQSTCGVQAWFVMRELVQGERRHGRLLARGIAISKQVASHLIASEVESAPVPVTQVRGMPRPTSLVEVISARTGDRLSALRSSTFSVWDRTWGNASAQSSAVNLTLDTAAVVEEPADVESPSDIEKREDSTAMRRSVSFSRITLARSTRPERDPAITVSPPRPTSMFTPSSSSAAPLSLAQKSARETHRQSLDILLVRLPRLLALSLTLSSRFAHDPSPDQIATAFLSMEDELTAEMAGWAADVGVLVGSGVGKEIDHLRRSSSQGLSFGVNGGRSASASPSLRSSLPQTPSASALALGSLSKNGSGLDLNSAAGMADRAALEALADSTAFMPRMGRANSYNASRPPSPGPSTQAQTNNIVSPTSIGSSISSFIGFGLSPTTGRAAQRTFRPSNVSTANGSGHLHPDVNGHTRNATTGSARADEQDRSSFSDVIMAPIQRVARYRMLFSTLVRKLEDLPTGSEVSRTDTFGSHASRASRQDEHPPDKRSEGHSLVRAALEASERLLKSVDAAQAYDLRGLRVPDMRKRSKSKLHHRRGSSLGNGKLPDEVLIKGPAYRAEGSLGGSANGIPEQAVPRSPLDNVGAGIDAAYQRHRSRLSGSASGPLKVKSKGKGKGKSKEKVEGLPNEKGEGEQIGTEQAAIVALGGSTSRSKSWGKDKKEWRVSAA